MKRKIIAVLTLLTFVASFLLATYFNDHDVNLQAKFNRVVHWVKSLLIENPKLELPPIKMEPMVVKLAQEVERPHVEVGSSKVCKDTSLGEVKYKKVGSVYTWVDERGIENFSSTPPNKGDFSLLNITAEKAFDYFSLNLITGNLPYDFNQKLTLKLNKLFEIYGQLLDRTRLKKVEINLRIYTSKRSFNQIKANHNMAISDNTPGFYSHATNQAHLLHTHHDATMQTAIHEATHGINRGIIGYSPAWLNEGLAEYSEHIEVDGRNGVVYPNKSWSDNHQIKESLLALPVLLNATENDWNSEMRARLYATSWAFIYFMMDNDQRKGMLSKIIQHEQKNLCDVIQLEQVEKTIGVSVENLQIRFERWSKTKLKYHVI